MLLKSYALRNNPFAIVPSLDNPFWADRKKLKSDLEEGIKFTLQGTQSQIIACIYGDWGSGKTHAMTYFSAKAVLEGIAKEVGIPSDRMLLSIPLIFPTKEVFNSIYVDIVYRNLIPRLHDVLSFLSKQTTPLEREGHLEEKLRNLKISEDLSRVLPQFLNSNHSMLVRRYLSRTASRNDLIKLSVAKGLDTDSEVQAALTDILKLFTGTIYSRIFIWIDDCERIADVPGKSMFEFQYFLRDTLDLLPERLTFIMTFTLLPGEDMTERMTYLGPAVQNRIAKVIQASYFELDEYLSYVDMMLENYRIKKVDKSLPKYYPFNEKCLLAIFEMLKASTTNLQPRTVNRVLSSLLERGLREGAPSIDEQFLEKAKEEVKAVIAS